ncbi:polysaccharide deacetylase family protein [Kitasatospora sp. NPDC051914]|uniref:polysaccharide deacetylase family protein n=1 Tax=Kitasatospora sp. NPDC051914 TaxID=3154945 RepID=UPI00342EB6B7
MPDEHAVGGGGTSTAPADTRRNRIDTLLRHSPLQPAFRAVAAGRLAVLAYHGIDDPQTFAAQMARLARTARPVTLARVEQAVLERRPLPPRSVLVTFDDGDRSLLTHGLPVLARHGIPAVAYVIAGLIGGDRPYWWSEAAFLVERGGTAAALPPGTGPDAAVRRLKQLPDAERRSAIDELRTTAGTAAPRRPQLTPADLRTLRDSGLAIGNHTVDHPCLDRCRPDEAAEQVAEAHTRLTGWLGEAPASFAYPNGNLDLHAERALTDLGYRTAFLFDHRHDRRLPRRPLRISRLRVNACTSMNRFDTILSGLHPAVHRLRGGR